MKVKSVLKDLRGREVDAFYMLLVSSGKYTFLPELHDIFGKEATIKFLDVFAGCTVKVPKVETIEKLARDAEIYIRIEQAPYSQQASIISELSLANDITHDRVRTIYARIKVKLEEFYGFKVTKR